MSRGPSRSHPAEDQAAEGAVQDVVEAVLVASRVLVAVSVRSLAELDEAVTPTQFRTLVVLDGHGQVNLNHVATILDVNASTAMRTIDRLLAAGLVTRAENPDNRREVLLGLTSAGAGLVAGVTSRRRREINHIVSAIPPAQRAALVEALHAFANASGEPRPRAATTAILGW